MTVLLGTYHGRGEMGTSSGRVHSSSFVINLWRLMLAGRRSQLGWLTERLLDPDWPGQDNRWPRGIRNLIAPCMQERV